MSKEKVIPAIEERRRIARRLRSLTKTYKQVFGAYICDVIGLDIVDDCASCYSSESVLRLADLIEPEPERTCRRTLVKSGAVYDVWHFDCCDREYAENKTDAGATELPLDVCPFCGTRVGQEEQDDV